MIWSREVGDLSMTYAVPSRRTPIPNIKSYSCFYVDRLDFILYHLPALFVLGALVKRDASLHAILDRPSDSPQWYVTREQLIKLIIPL